jgi:hypothetical protein
MSEMNLKLSQLDLRISLYPVRAVRADLTASLITSQWVFF